MPTEWEKQQIEGNAIIQLLINSENVTTSQVHANGEHRGYLIKGKI